MHYKNEKDVKTSETKCFGLLIMENIWRNKNRIAGFKQRRILYVFGNIEMVKLFSIIIESCSKILKNY